MFIFGHSGISAGAVHALDRRTDLRWVPLWGLLPDLIDKPVGKLLPWFANGWSRTVGHSLLGFAVFSLGAILVARKRAWIAVVPYGLHLLLDRMWDEIDRPILLWPFTGFELPPHESPYAHWWGRFLEPWQLGGEITGLAILVALVLRGRFRRERLDFPTTDMARPADPD